MTDPIDDLDRILAELDTRRAETPAAGSALEGWLRAVAERDASDLLLVAGEPPAFRIQGRIVRSEAAVLDGVDIEEMVLPELPPHAQTAFRDTGTSDASRRVPGVGRFRINLHRERGRAAAAIRMLPRRVPSLADLELPPGTELLAQLPRGLVLIGGATGSGKTTTLAALIGEINQRHARHIITIEDPIEYEHTNDRSIVQQIEIGVDAPSFPIALRAALRQAPDVIVIGEMRDPETMHIALAAGETGHLVFSTPAHDRCAFDNRAHDGLVSRRTTAHHSPGNCRRAHGGLRADAAAETSGRGRVPAAELLLVGYGARQHIRRNALQHLHQEITITRRHGSFSLEECLARLVKTGLVARAEAAVRANHVADFEQALGT